MRITACRRLAMPPYVRLFGLPVGQVTSICGARIALTSSMAFASAAACLLSARPSASSTVRTSMRTCHREHTGCPRLSLQNLPRVGRSGPCLGAAPAAASLQYSVQRLQHCAYARICTWRCRGVYARGRHSYNSWPPHFPQAQPRASSAFHAPFYIAHGASHRWLGWKQDRF